MTLQASGRTSTLRAVALSVGAAFVVSGVIDTGVALAARALGADPRAVGGLNTPAYLLFALIGLLVAAIVWSLVRARAAHPQAVMRVLVPVVVALSLVPDVLVGVAGLGWVGAVALMVMHLVVAVCGVVAFRRFLPLSA